MMKDINDIEKWDQFCARLLKMTIDGDISWEDWAGRIGRPDVRSPLFVASYKQWRILIYQYAYKYFHDEDRYDWVEDVAIELIDDEGRTEWMFPKVPSRHRLLDHIQYKHADVDSLFEDIIGSRKDA